MWNKLYFNCNNIEHETERATLIKLPSKSEYSDYKFWHTNKLVRRHEHKKHICSLSFTDDFKFKVFKTGKGKNNKYDIVDEIVLNPSDIKEAFYNDSYTEDVIESDRDSYLKIVKPQKVEIEEGVLDCLKNN